ncbi:putative sulfate transporter 3.3 [Abeliophyllum distichum]|uniref:Sulfate transporter 3.3 n=1 Tax=Abeliophyllum distichum TaxID=126358 RepID=A0ABD1U1G6_9LAMI
MDALGLLKIRVRRGINLAVRDAARGSSDPYAIVTCGAHKVKTSVVKSNLNPEWNEELTISIKDLNVPIVLTVHDKDTFSLDDNLGNAEIDIKPYIDCLRMGFQGSMRKPKLFWVSAGAPLLSVMLSTLLVFAFKAQNHGISVIGKLQEGLNPPSWNMLHFHGSHLGLVMKTGLVTGIISLTEGIAVGRTFAALKNYQVDGNKEMIAIGLMNIVGSSTSCYVTTGSFSRSAVNHNAGCKTAVSNIIMSVTVMVTLLLLMPLFQYTPNVVLGAIIITAVIGLIDIPAAYQIWKIDKFDFLVLLCAFLGVIFISVQEGLAIAVGISIFKVLLQITRPKAVMLGNIPGTNIYRDLHHYQQALRVPGFLILSIEAPINFANTTYLKERISRWIEEYEVEDENAKKQSTIKFIILDLSAVSAIDTNGVSFFKDLRMVLEKKGLELVLVNPLGEVIEKLQRADDYREFARPDCMFLTVEEAVAAHLSTIKNQSSNHV